jgi:cell division protein FtsX
MTAVVTVLTFLSVLAFGIALSIGTGVIRWNSEWNKYATIQIINPDNSASVKKILDDNKNKIENVKEISKSEMEQMMRPWVSNGAKINNYLPQMFEIKIKKSADIKILKEQIAPKAKFLTHSSALQSSIAAGWKLFGITAFVLVLILVSIGVCISYISRNIAMLHKHELEILNQVGATDKFIARQMQIIVAKISCIAAFIGFVAATPIIAVILSTAHSARIGLLATLTLSGTDIFALLLLPVLIVVFSVYITKKTTIKILSEN